MENASYKELNINIDLAEESSISSSDENFNRVTAMPRGKRLILRAGMILAVVAFVGAGVKVFQGRAQPQAGAVNSVEEKASAIAIGTQTCPANGMYFAPSKSCCLKTCGSLCGAKHCQTAAAGYQNCCTSTFTKLCGSAGVVAPCKMPTTVSGTLQTLMSGSPTRRLEGVQAATSRALASSAFIPAVQAAISAVLSVPVEDVSAKISTPASPGRRLTVAVNVEYQVRFAAEKALTPAAIVTKSAGLFSVLDAKMKAAGVTVTLEKVVVPTPVTFGAGSAVATPDVPLLSFTTTTPEPTHKLTTLFYLTTASKATVLESPQARVAIAAALNGVFRSKDGTVTGLGDGGGEQAVKGGYIGTVPVSVTEATLAAESTALLAAVQKHFSNDGIDAIVTAVGSEPPTEAAMEAEPGV